MKFFVTLCALLVSTTGVAAQPEAKSVAAPALGLPRLRSTAAGGEATAAIAPSRFDVALLSSTEVAGVSKSHRDETEYLTVDSGKEWSRPLRAAATEVAFVSFQLNASQSTIVDIAGARLGFTAGPAGGLQLMVDDPSTEPADWRSLNYHVDTSKFDGKDLAELPTLTVRLDPAQASWDLYIGSRLVASDLPLIESKRSDQRISIRPGKEGARITGLVLSDENPLYADANANGIADDFERAQRGDLLSATAAKADRQALAQQWQAAQRATPPSPLAVQRPLADGVKRSSSAADKSRP